MKFLVLIGLLLGFSGPGSAGEMKNYYSGSDLLATCGTDLPKYNIGVCIGYLKSVSDMHNLMVEWEILEKNEWCMPDGVTTEQLKEIVEKYISAYPEYLTFGASSVVWNAFLWAFPCE